MTDEWMKCPKCGSEGMNAGHYDWIFKNEVMEFWCDKDDTHHFLIVQLPPTEYLDSPSALNCIESEVEK